MLHTEVFKLFCNEVQMVVKELDTEMNVKRLKSRHKQWSRMTDDQKEVLNE